MIDPGLALTLVILLAIVCGLGAALLLVIFWANYRPPWE